MSKYFKGQQNISIESLAELYDSSIIGIAAVATPIQNDPVLDHTCWLMHRHNKAIFDWQPLS